MHNKCEKMSFLKIAFNAQSQSFCYSIFLGLFDDIGLIFAGMVVVMMTSLPLRDRTMKVAPVMTTQMGNC